MSEEIVEELASASSSQSSIIKPNVTDSDMKFFTFRMFGRSGHNPTAVKVEDVIVPGSNTQLLANSNTWGLLQFKFRRRFLTRLHELYALLLLVAAWYEWTWTLVNVYLWWVINILDLFPRSLKAEPETLDNKLQVSAESETGSFFTRLRESPTRLGNLALARSLAIDVPKSALTIRQAVGDKTVPQHLMAIYELSPLVVPPPPELPTPYLTADKKIVVPDKKEMSKTLSERAEWAAAHHTHKASEVIRVCTESARVVAWALYSGTKTLTLYERSGNCWKDLERLSSIIQTELAGLTSEDATHHPWIKLVNLSLSQTLTIEDSNNSYNAFESHPGEFTGLEAVEPAPITSDLASAKILESSSPSTGLTVILVSEADGKNRLVQLVQNYLAKSGETVETFVDRELDAFDAPELILQFARPRGLLDSFCGAPVYNLGNRPLFESTQSQTTFAFYIKALDTFSADTARKD